MGFDEKNEYIFFFFEFIRSFLQAKQRVANH